MIYVCVRTQEELDEALANPEHKYGWHIIVVCSPRGVWLKIGDSRGQDVVASGEATVEAAGRARVRALDHATIIAYVDATVIAHGDATVIAHGDATVRAFDNVTVESFGNSIVTVMGDASVKAHDRTAVRAYDDSRVKAGPCVPVHVHSKNVTRQGGVVIDMTAFNANDPETWCAMHLVEVDEDGQAHLYKALDADLNAGHAYRLTHYPIGHVVDDTANWVDNNKCGGGLHVSPTPWVAKEHYGEASRFVEVMCPVEELRPIDSSKAKAPRLRVLREVTVEGSPIGGETR